MKQTSVEWVFQELDNYYQMKSKFKSKKEIFKQAKEMEKQQQGYSEEEIAIAYNEGQAYSVTGKLVDGKEWVKTHKKEWFEQFKNK
jgi:hypothetical protein